MVVAGLAIVAGFQHVERTTWDVERSKPEFFKMCVLTGMGPPERCTAVRTDDREVTALDLRTIVCMEDNAGAFGRRDFLIEKLVWSVKRRAFDESEFHGTSTMATMDGQDPEVPGYQHGPAGGARDSVLSGLMLKLIRKIECDHVGSLLFWHRRVSLLWL